MTFDGLADLLHIADHLPWMRWASCAESDPDLWRAEDSSAAQAERAKAIGRRCPVRRQCLAYAMEAGEEHGVWGGMSPNERRGMGRDAAA